MKKGKLKFLGVVLLVCVMSVLVFSKSSFAYLKWKVFQDDDGKPESHWGMTGSHAGVLCKIFNLETEPGRITQAFIKYEMASDPYHGATKRAIRTPEQAIGLKMPDMIIKYTF